MSILSEANDIIYGERVKNYGNPTDTFQKGAWILTQLTGKPWTAQDIVKAFIIMKQLRNEHSPDNPDHTRDIAGYIGILHDIQQKVDSHE